MYKLLVTRWQLKFIFLQITATSIMVNLYVVYIINIVQWKSLFLPNYQSDFNIFFWIYGAIIDEDFRLFRITQPLIGA